MNILKTMFKRGDEVAPIHIVFFSVAAVAALQFPASMVMMTGHVMIGIVLNQTIAILGVPLALIWLMKYDRRQLLVKTWPGFISVVLFVLITLSADILIEYMTALSEYLAPLPDRIRYALEKLMVIDGTSSLMIKVSVLCLLPAVCEEVFFRGFCQTSIAKRFGNLPAILVSAVLFAMLHGNPWYIHLYLILGLFLGWAYAVTGTLIVPMVCHFFNNFWTIAINHYDLDFPANGELGIIDISIILGSIICFVLLFRVYKYVNNNK